jgi:hypothetical protein
MKRVVLASFLAVFLLWNAQPAAAGGAHFSFEQEGYRPGDLAVGRTGVSWGHNERLGDPTDGPYFAYLVPPGASTQYFDGGAPIVPREAIKVAEVAIQNEPIEQFPGFVVGPHGASIEFVVPDLAPGSYFVTHCNDPCTTQLGDIIGGQLEIVAAGDVAPATTTVATTVPSTVPPTTADPSFVAEPIAQGRQQGSNNLGRVALGAGVAFVAVALTAFVSGRARQSSAK